MSHPIPGHDYDEETVGGEPDLKATEKEESSIVQEMKSEFDQAELEGDFWKMDDIILRLRKIEYLNTADELYKRRHAVYSNPSKYDDDSDQLRANE